MVGNALAASRESRGVQLNGPGHAGRVTSAALGRVYHRLHRQDPDMTPSALHDLIHRDFASARGGNARAFERMVVATQRMVASVALAVTRDVATSEDIAQDTYLRAWQHLGRMQHPDSFLPWLRQVARNRAIDHLRASRPSADADVLDVLPADGDTPEQAHDRHVHADALAQALDALPEDTRDVLLLYYREGQSSQAVAALLGLSDAAVRKRLQRGRDSLRADVLQRLGETATRSAPGLVFTATVAAGLTAGTSPAAATALTAGAVAKSLPKLALATVGALAAAIVVMLGGIAWEIRDALRRTSDPRRRRTLVVNGVVYGALMAGYVVALAWSKQQGWSDATVLTVAVVVSLLVVVLALQRARLVRSDKR